MSYQKSSKKFKKAAILVGLFLVISLIYPLFKSPQGRDVTSAGAEIRFTKGAQVKQPALGQEFITWIEYRDGAYNLYLYDFVTKEERQLNNVPLSVETVGPIVYQNHVYWVDHPAGAWIFTDYNVDHRTVSKLEAIANRVDGLAVYDNFLVFSAQSGTGTDIFLLNKNSAKVESQNITNDEAYQTAPSIYGNLITWAEFPLICDGLVGLTKCQPGESGRIITYDLLSGYKSALKENVPKLSEVKLQNLTLAWSQLQDSRQIVSVYYINTGVLVTVSPADFNSYNPVLSSGLITYFVNRGSGTDLDYYQFDTYKHGTVSWNKAKKSQVTISPDNKKIAWLDDRLGIEDIFYYDFQADETIADQDIDGVNDIVENQKGTNPFDPDTDHDGLTDYEEIYRYKTYPSQYDSDGDGLTDGQEVKNWLTNPLAFDTDGDGYDDKTEIANGYSPLVAGPKRPEPPEFRQALIYGNPRLSDWTIESQMALELRQQLDGDLGPKGWGVKNAQDWYKVVNAYVYGSYRTDEIAQYVTGSKLAIHESIEAVAWRSMKHYASEGGLKAAMY